MSFPILFLRLIDTMFPNYRCLLEKKGKFCYPYLLSFSKPEKLVYRIKYLLRLGL